MSVCSNLKKIIAAEKSVLKRFIPYLIGVFLIVGCASISEQMDIGRTLFIPIKSEPQSARVYLDGKIVGYTPATVKVFYLHARDGLHSDEMKTRILKIEKDGFKPYFFSFTISGREYEKLPEVIHLKKIGDKEVVVGNDSSGKGLQNKSEKIELEKDPVKKIERSETGSALIIKKKKKH